VTIATVVETNVANKVVGTMPAGSDEPAAARRAMTPVGSSVTLDVLMATKPQNICGQVHNHRTHRRVIYGDSRKQPHHEWAQCFCDNQQQPCPLSNFHKPQEKRHHADKTYRKRYSITGCSNHGFAQRCHWCVDTDRCNYIKCYFAVTRDNKRNSHNGKENAVQGENPMLRKLVRMPTPTGMFAQSDRAGNRQHITMRLKHCF
jgi:hypothetical protein